MSQDLLTKMIPRLKGLGEGGYVRGYRSRRGWSDSSTRQTLAGILDGLGIPYKENVPVGKSGPLKADFLVNGTLVFVDRELDGEALRSLSGDKRKRLVINRESVRSDMLDNGLRIVGLGEEGRVQTIFLDDPSFNFDYAHILPKTQKCSVMHGHTSSVLVEVVGRPIDGMVVDFADAKKIVKEAVRSLDHKLFINEKYVTKMDGRSVTLMFETVHGEFAIQAPKQTTVMLDGEATVENLAREVLSKIAPLMPENVSAVGVYVYEGLNKGSHLLARIHRDEVEKRRKKR